jgi:hypothetical protein
LKRKNFKTQYLRKSKVTSRGRPGRSIIVETGYEETEKKERGYVIEQDESSFLM